MRTGLRPNVSTTLMSGSEIVQLAMTNLRQSFGDLTLMKARWRDMIATDLATHLARFAVEWGLTVSKVKIRLIDPPEDIK
ncbi:MAG: hypothetical protein R2932_59720 [Caldilineaceae bacterium]